ncbi:hypothetical protein CspHIS471_0211960 [Cutaneotrichosporon sp. HIS471]|nr:hypothetical protein CspHIS471_0211960 [Cutaneotrichosporon sp. HIS471]
MTIAKYTITEPLLDLNMDLGEGCVWDARSKRLYFVDIDLNDVYVYDPATEKYGVNHFDKNVTAIALLEDGEGLVASVEDDFAFIPPSSVPQPTQARFETPKMVPQTYDVIKTSTVTGQLTAGEARMNEGAVDPAGRFLAGTMGSGGIGTHDGRMFSLRQTRDGFDAPPVLGGITCTNGMAWFDGGRKMYFTDSWVKEIAVFDYDLAKGTMSNRRVFSDMKTPDVGYPDGLCLDVEGGVWSARWCAGKVVRLNPETAQIDVEIDIPSSWNVTCCIFGGDNLDDLYITTAKCDTDNQNPPDRTEKGKLYRISGLGYRGVERGRFKGKF